jgi:signal transduction histidine kinase/FixJ family two-component response regulator
VRPRPTQLLDYREFPLLYVDDEPDNLRVFELTFRREFSILTATSAEAGLRLLNANPVAVVLSDQRMPEVTGVEFLSRVRDIDPKTIRILVTAYGDVDILGEAINDGSIFRYVPKPWEPEDMRLTVRRAIEMYALERERSALLEELTLLNRLSRTLHREMDLDRLVELLLNATHHELGFDGAALLFFDKPGDTLSWRGLAPSDDEVARGIAELRFTRDTAPNFLDRLLKGDAQALRVNDQSKLEKPVRDWVTEVSADEILVVPLVGKNEVIGALAVDNRSGGRRLGADDRTLLDGLGMQAVIAIENARLVDDLRTSRAQVLRADRLGTLGTLAAGLAHEINNPLVSIHTFLSLAPEKRPDDDPSFWGEYHQLATSELERIRGLVATMSRLAHGGGETTGPEKSLVDLGDLAQEVVHLMQPEVTNAGITLLLDCPNETPKVLGVRDHLHQVMLNLLLNAIQATPEDGVVHMKVQPNPDRPQDSVIVLVEDSGRGIPEESLERIFDPFFTTKDVGEGTGLGLSVSRNIVELHRGCIDIRNRAEGGASAVLLFKLATGAPDEEKDPAGG